MECKKYSELMSADMDEMISPHEKEQLMAHLMVCEKCSEEMRALKQMKSLLEQMESPELPDGFHEELMTRIKQEKKSKVVHAFKWKWQYSGALVAALMIGFLGIGQMIPLSMQNKPSAKSVTRAEVAPYEAQEGAISEASFYEPEQGVQVASEQPNIAGRSRLISEEDEASLQETRWQVNIKEKPDFVEQLKIYLERASEQPNIAGRSRLISEEDEASLQETRWQVNIKEKPDFVEQLKIYLESTGISYEIYQEEVICHQVTDYEGLMKWVQEQGVEYEGEVVKAADKLIIELEQ